MNRRERLVALHEAGHAVAVLALGGRLLSVGALPAGRELGRALWTGLEPRADAIASLAGAAAWVIAGEAAPYAGAATDYGRALELLLGDMTTAEPPARVITDLLPELGRLELEARALLYHHGEELAAGAGALATAGFMTGSQFAAAAGGRLSHLAAELEAAKPPPAPPFVVVDRCVVHGWQLPMPRAAFLATSPAELDLWRVTLRGLLCGGPHGE